VQRRAADLGARPRAAERARRALEVVADAAVDGATDGSRVVLTAGGPLGEHAVLAAGLEPRVVYEARAPEAGAMLATTSADTTAAARALVAAGATLVLFAGGDGTARDVAAGLADEPVAALGIPAGVKMYSPVFAVSPRAAGALAAAWDASSSRLPVQEREVLDIDEAELGRTRVEPRLHAMMRVPFRAGRTQARKAATPAGEQSAVVAAARGAVQAMRPGIRYLLGPGGTMSEVARQLGVAKTPLGVDVVLDGRVLLAGASEQGLLDEVSRGPAAAVVTVIGGQGFLLGRGNQQLSARVLDRLGERPLIVVAPEQKLIDLGGRPLLVDTGDPALDTRLAGFATVITGTGTTSVYPVRAPDAPSEPPASEPLEIEGEGHAP
ncbi:ATP-NAD kinase family protein, partial [Agromyces terreus]